MATDQLYKKDLLEVQQQDEDKTIRLSFRGKSILREPADFLMPLLISSLSVAGVEDKRLVLDFRELAYMNSSTLTPLIKILERARAGRVQVTALYLKQLKWQDISFSALDIFRTQDGRIQIKGL